MTMERASVFDQGPEIDISGFKPRTAIKPAAQPDQVKAISESASFVSREPIQAPRQTAAPAPPVARSAEDTILARQAQREPITREPRRHRTGRNIQLNIKARAETIDRFYALADRNGWVLGETFERAIAALERTSTN
jgi:hypothetical protein